MKLQKNIVINNYLRSIGISKSEAEVYLSGLEIGPICRIQELIGQTPLKESTLYAALSRLEQKNIVSLEQDGREVVCSFLPLEKLSTFIRSKVDIIEKQVDELSDILSALQIAQPPSTVEAHSVSEVKALLVRALQCRTKKWDIIAPRRTFLKDLDSEFLNYFKATRKLRAIDSRTLWEQPLTDAFSVSLYDVKTRKPRLLPLSYTGSLKAMMILFDTSVLLVDDVASGHAVLVESEGFFRLQSVLFESIWLQAKKA